METHLACLKDWATFRIINEAGCNKPSELLLLMLPSAKMKAVVLAEDLKTGKVDPEEDHIIRVD